MRIGRTIAAGALALVATAVPAGPAAADDPVRPVPREIDVQARPIGRVAPTAPSARLATTTFGAPAPGRPERVTFTTTVTRNPQTAVLLEPGFTRPDETCAAPVCTEVTVDVPAGRGRTLYARAAWSNLGHYVHLWGVAPDGTVVGRADVTDSYDKQVGNELAVPVAEFTVADPQPGTWRVQVRAVFGHAIRVSGLVALAAGRALEYPRLDVRALADRHLRQHVTMNVVFAGREWSPAEVAQFRAQMPPEFQPVVVGKQATDCGSWDDNGITSVRSWQVCDFTGTQGPGAPGAKPYFEPVKLTFGYRFLQADQAWTRDLFAAMERATTRAEPFDSPQTAAFLASYDAAYGRPNRGLSAAVADPTVGDKIDAIAVEDWVFDHRLDPRYARSFRDLETGDRVSPRFVDPDPAAYYDPFYARRGIADIPQGAATSLTFFVLDTFSNRDLADQYFRPDAYHFFDVSKAMIDPDSKRENGPDFSRVWGGRYRFFLHDLGAGPNDYEIRPIPAGPTTGSGSYPDGDPPIWEYDNDPRWAGKLAERTARDAVTMLLYRFVPSYTFRPIPADVYFLASNIWHDCYANPACSPDGIGKTDLTTIYDAAWVERNLGSALPGTTFTTERSDPHLATYRYLGCARERAVGNPDRVAGGDTVLLAPDPNCAGRPSDPIQHALERAKASGDDVAGAGFNDFGVSAHVVRGYVEEHRADIAPQPPGQFTMTNIITVFPGASTYFLPLPGGGGVALATPNGEAWGMFQSVNEVRKKAGDTGMSYVSEHEVAHFIGLLHPHDGVLVQPDANGRWQRYGYSYRQYGDFSQAPTTYAGSFAPYSVLDQDLLQRGHAAEYLKRMQDHLSDAYLVDGAAGLTTPSALTRRKVTESARWRDAGSALFGCGDYLEAERAMRNAALAASGVFGPVVPARRLRAGEQVLFDLRTQPVYGPDGAPMPGCAAATPGQVAAPRQRRLAATGSDVTLPVVALALGTFVAYRRRARTLR